MFLLQLLSSSIFVLPVLVTFGIYFGVDHQRILECGFHCGEVTPGDPYNPFHPQANVTDFLYCEKSYAIIPPPGRYIFNPNQWGDPHNDGALCLKFTTSGLGGPKDYAAGWAATWQYPQGTREMPVHAFPNAALNRTASKLPVPLSDLTGLSVDVSWSYNSGSSIKDSTDYDGLSANDVNANVCVDMFLAPNQTSATSTTDSAYEVMVWLARLGAATDPLGFALGILDTRTINGTAFHLYYENNSLGQHAFTWLAEKNTTDFTGDIGPLLQNLEPFAGPSGTDYLGYVAFGSETLYADRNVTFYVPKLEMTVLY